MRVFIRGGVLEGEGSPDELALFCHTVLNGGSPRALPPPGAASELAVPIEDGELAPPKRRYTKRIQPTSEKKVDRRVKRVLCPDCGEKFKRQGLGAHRARAHPATGAATAPPRKGAARPAAGPAAVALATLSAHFEGISSEALSTDAGRLGSLVPTWIRRTYESFGLDPRKLEQSREAKNRWDRLSTTERQDLANRVLGR